jgi:uncharacterized phage protein (TIGR02220 family)
LASTLVSLRERLERLEQRLDAFERRRKPKRPGEYSHEVHEATANAIGFLNEEAGGRFRASTKAYLKLVARLLADGWTVKQMRCVVWHRALEWKGTEQEPYLRPETLFGPEKFPSYSAQAEKAYLAKGGVL